MKTDWILKLFIIGFVIFLIDRIGLWAEQKGWVYWRKKKSSSGVGNALAEFESFMRPSVKHVILVQEQKDAKERDGQGEGNRRSKGSSYSVESYMKLHIFGASGSGTTSLGKTLASDQRVRHFDADDYYWKKTDPPFTHRNSIEERYKLLLDDMKGLDSWILSGSMDSWSEPFCPFFDAVIFVRADADLRVQRLKEREHAHYGDRINPGGDMFEWHEYFIKWAHQYEKGELPGRSLERHETWMKTLNCPVLKVNNNGRFEDLLAEVKSWLNGKFREKEGKGKWE